MVLVEAAPHGVGPLVRGLLPEYPTLTVETRAHRLFAADEGQVVVFMPNLDEAQVLNFNRPILSQRRLKVVLVGERERSGRLARTAPDFFHWISHWLKGPTGAPPETIHRLRMAARAHAMPIEWIGGRDQLEAAFPMALAGAGLEFMSAKARLDRLIAAATPRRATWIAWMDVEHPYDYGRLQTAWQRAGRGGRNLLVSPQELAFLGANDGVVRIDARTLDLADAMRRLDRHGVNNAGRLAALGELSRPSIEKIEHLLDAGNTPSEIEERIAKTSRPWEVLDEWLGLRTTPDARAVARARDESDEASLALGLLDHARLLEQQGMLAEAEPLVREGLALYEELFGIDHGLTRGAVRQLTHLLKARGRYGEAILELLRMLKADATTPGPRHPTNHWLYEEDVKAAQELLFLVSGIRDSELTRRAYEAVRAALGDEAKETKALAAWVERLSAPKDS